MYNKKIQKIILGFLLIFLIILAGITANYYIKQKIYKSKILKKDETYVTNFEECVRSGGQVIDVYPRRCITKDKLTYIEQLKETTIDTNDWMTIDATGYSFKCPPGWDCRKINDIPNQYNSVTNSVVVSSPDNIPRISTFCFFLITPENFQKSMIKHPGYATPIQWFNDLKIKSEKSIKVLPSTIMNVPGTDGLIYPAYYGYDFNKMLEINTDSGLKGLIFPPSNSNIPDTNIIIPLNDNDLVLIYLSQSQLINNPIINKILTSIKF